MNYDESLLWSKLENFSISKPDDALPFSRRLARENGWTETFAEQVILEYKKFLFLCVVSPQPVTPSDQVDQAWHLHLVYTRSYWTDLCKNILGKDIHHTPTEGGAAENEKFVNYYEATLALYKKKFGEAPPEDIWPATQQRFSDIDFVRANKRTHWIVKRLHWSYNKTGILLIIGGMLLSVALHTAVLLTVSFIGILFLLPWSQMTGKESDAYASTCGSGCNNDGHHGNHHGGHDGHSGCSGHGGGDSGCSGGSGCSGCGSGCGGGGD